jgi:hypothetical protein
MPIERETMVMDEIKHKNVVIVVGLPIFILKSVLTAFIIGFSVLTSDC